MNKKQSLQWNTLRIFQLADEPGGYLALSVIFSCFLVLVRIACTGRPTFLSLIWNLFLAFVPYFITKLAASKPGWIPGKIGFIGFFLLWLVWIPNSFYILTDLFHLRDSPADRVIPLWFDLVLILSFSWNGCMLGILSVRQMEKVLLRYVTGVHTLFFLFPVMWLNAWGIYIGRYLRFNSWDVISDPFQLLVDIGEMLLHPLAYRNGWSMISCFSVLLTLMYLTIKKIGKSIR
ncbi:MAG TPA: DUF1361 domain-containing protein [Puia sp.]|jgi:uncharacterized membrane protein|nr:DUF1361 domain-containing protein [Puia sp.]